MITLFRNSPFLHRIYLESALEKVTESQQWLISTLHPTHPTIHTISCQTPATIAQTKIMILPQSRPQITSLPSQTPNHRPPSWQSSTRMCPLQPALSSFSNKISLLERPENHHMIRWDPAGEHIIVERPEQLALHVLPSIYRQSRFASFSRQLNVNLLS